MQIAGIDYSMSCPAIVTCESTSPFCFSNCSIHYLIETKKYAGKFGTNVFGHYFDRPSDDIARFIKISEWAEIHIRGSDSALVEGYSMGSKGNVFQIAENTAMLKMQLYNSKIKFCTIPPTTLKKFASGKGNAKKEEMYDAFFRETKVDLFKLLDKQGESIGNPISDIVDAYYIAKHLYHTPI